MYAYFKKLDYFSTECIYSPNAYRGFARELIKDLERVRPQCIIDIIKSAETFQFDVVNIKKQVLSRCEKCNYISSQKICRACVFLEGLNKGHAKLSIFESEGRTSKNKLRQSKDTTTTTTNNTAVANDW
jgi:cytoplasmic tRNA 2-thiolation protein 1